MLNKRQSQRIKLIRCIAILLILLSHIFQEYGIHLGAYTNIGVQIFLVISGFLIGQSETIFWKKWTLRRVIRILPSYYIILLTTATAYWFILDENIIGPQFLCHFITGHFLFFPGYPFWGGHLWYITAIAICYMIVPVLVWTRRLHQNAFLFLNLVAAPIFLALVFYKTAMPYRLSGDIFCFIAGFVGANVFKQKIPDCFTAASLLIALLFIAFHYTAVQNNYWNIEILKTIFRLLWPWERCLYGISLCTILYLPAFTMTKSNMVINFFDKYSYEIYLSHKNFILGPLSLLYISQYPSLNLVVALSASLICAFIVAEVASIVKVKAEPYTAYQK